MSKGLKTKELILKEAFAKAGEVGLSGLTIGDLSSTLGMSKSGLFAHFQSKENLEVAVLDWTRAKFARTVLGPALKHPRGEPRLRAFFDNWITWIETETIGKGGCLIVGASIEYDDRPGVVRDSLLSLHQELQNSITRMVHACIEEGHFSAEVDPEQFAFELYSLILGFHHFSRMLGDEKSLQRLRQSFETLMKHGKTYEQ